MQYFLEQHKNKITGVLSTYDRIIFKGYLSRFFFDSAFKRFLYNQGILMKDFGQYVEKQSAVVKKHARRIAQDADRPYIDLQSTHTRKTGKSKEELAKEVAAKDGITEGLICVLGAVEPCTSFKTRINEQTHRLEILPYPRKCLHLYFYYYDREFGFMHVRLQSWFPLTIQVYINARQWLARQLDEFEIDYDRYENCFTWIEDLDTADALCEKFAHRQWARVLNALAGRVNPLLAMIRQAGFGQYYWCMDQVEYATDIMFRDRHSLESVYPDLVEWAITGVGAEDVMRFLGRKLRGNFKGQVTTDSKRRPEGVRIKHRVNRNSIKMYDKALVLRVETTINNPSEFKVFRRCFKDGSLRWQPMRKGVSDFWRFSQVARQANERYLESLCGANPKGKVIKQLDSLCRSHKVGGKRVSRFNPVSSFDCHVFKAVLLGEHSITGFRNKDLRGALYSTTAASDKIKLRRTAHVSRLLAKLRAHGLIGKVKDSRLYRVTKRGIQLMSAALTFRNIYVPNHMLSLA